MRILPAIVFAATVAAAQAQPMDMSQHQHGAPSEEDLPALGTGPSVQFGGALGDYPMMRDASGTSWQPDSAPMDGIHGITGDWATMLHGYIAAIYDHASGPRGDDKTFSSSMLMGMAQRSLGAGHLTLKGMISLDALMGKSGYPLLFQTGETADGVAPLVDRQHPHDFLMELAGIYSTPLNDAVSGFVYVGYPGEPALGPPAFMHRFSTMNNPEAPIGHHWLDATHITYGVATLGLTTDAWKIEGSIFNGREPDRYRWEPDRLRLNSASTRLSWNPTSDWAFQVSYGFIKDPEQLEPGVRQHRVTASGIYNKKLAHGNWQTTLAWGQNNQQPGVTSNAYLLESAIGWYQHSVFARVEDAQKNELFQAGPLEGQMFEVTKFSLGYVYDIPIQEHLSLGLGAVGSLYALPSALDPAYGTDPSSYMLFVRVKLI